MSHLLQVTDLKPQSRKDSPKKNFSLTSGIKGLFRRATGKNSTNPNMMPPARGASLSGSPRVNKAHLNHVRLLPSEEVAARAWPVAERVVEFYLSMELGSKYQGV